MTLEQLRIFVAVAEELHVTRAARRLAITQSGASAAIAALEVRCGVRLFDRVGRAIRLTQAGETFLPEARAVLARTAQAERVLSELAGLGRGRLNLHASQTIASYWLPPLLNRYHSLYPGIALQLTIGNTAQVAQAVAAGEADLGFVEGEVDDPLLVRISVPGDRLVLVVAPGHPFATTRALAPGELARTSWVLRERGSGTRQMFEAAMARFGIDPDTLTVALELPSNEAVRAAVEAGAGATVISHLVVEAGLRAGTLVAADIPFPERRFFALRHGDRHRASAEEALLALVRGTLPTAAPLARALP